MPQLDLPLAQLYEYRADVSAPADLDEFWSATLAEAGRHELNPSMRAVDSGLIAVQTYDVEFTGYGNHRIRAWLHLPAPRLRGVDPLPGVVQYQGYNGGRGLAHEHVFWACAGYAHLVMDTRGQGSGWTVGDTGDPVGAGPAQPGFLTRGADDPYQHYYRRVYTDAVRALDVLRGHPSVDSGRIAVTGHSQGGGLALAVAALCGGPAASPGSRAGTAPAGIAAVMADVPFLCDFPRAARITATDPYAEISRYLAAHRDRAERLFRTLSYFDAAVLATWASAPALFSVALMDQICPPSTVFGAYHAYGGRKQISVYEFNDHEGGEAAHRRQQLTWLATQLEAHHEQLARTEPG